jgi:hypothetical protein
MNGVAWKIRILMLLQVLARAFGVILNTAVEDRQITLLSMTVLIPMKIAKRQIMIFIAHIIY